MSALQKKDDLFRAMLSTKKWYVHLLRANGILLDFSCCIMVIPEFDKELLDAVFAHLDAFLESRFRFRHGKFRRCAFLYSDNRIERYIESVHCVETLPLCCTHEELLDLIRLANFFYVDTRIKIISLDYPFGRRADRLLASGKVSKADIVQYGLPARYQDSDISSFRFLLLNGRMIAFIQDICIPLFSFFVRLLPWNFFDFFYWQCVIAHGRKVFLRLGGGTRLLAICPYKGTGDVYLAMSFFAKYVEHNSVPDYTVCVQGAGNKNVCRLFINGDVVSLSLVDMLCLVRYYFAMEFSEDSVMMLHQAPPTFRHDIVEFLRNVEGLNFYDFYKYVVFNQRVVAPAQPVFSSDTAAVSHLFRSTGLHEGRTVLLAPVAYTLLNLPDAFWRTLVVRLKAACWDVALNFCHGERQLKGSIPLCVPYPLLVPFVQKAGAFICIRSGLCELISTAKCRKIIIYPKIRQGSGSCKDFFSMHSMGLCEDAFEIEYCGEETIRAVMSAMDSGGVKKCC